MAVVKTEDPTHAEAEIEVGGEIEAGAEIEFDFEIEADICINAETSISVVMGFLGAARARAQHTLKLNLKLELKSKL